KLFAVESGDDHIAETLENLRACVINTAVGAHCAVRGARLGVELHARIPKIELRLVIEDKHRVCLELALLHAITGEQSANAKSHLLCRVDRRLNPHRRLLDILAGASCPNSGDGHPYPPNARDRSHPTRARMRSCKCTTPTSSSVSFTTGIAMIPCCSIR